MVPKACVRRGSLKAELRTGAKAAGEKTKDVGAEVADKAGDATFELDSNGTPERRAWTEVGTDDAWLVLVVGRGM